MKGYILNKQKAFLKELDNFQWDENMKPNIIFKSKKLNFTKYKY